MTLQQLNSSHFKNTIYILTFIGSVVSAALFIDSRYAYASDLRQHTQQMQRDVRLIAIEVRRQLLEDKVFELDLVPENQRTQTHRALINRYKTQLQQLQERELNRHGSS